MIYFVQESGFSHVKIGYAKDVWARLPFLQTGSAHPLVLLAVEEGDRARERELHARFATYRQKGEWFKPCAELMAYIEALGVPPQRPSSDVSARRAFWGGRPDKEVAADVGISCPTLSAIRAGKRRPSPELAIRLQRVTGRSAIELVFGDLAAEAA